MTRPRPFAQWLDWLLTTDPRQRIRLVQCGTAGLLMIASATAALVLAWFGIVPLRPFLIWAAVAVPGVVIFFIVVRTGANRRFAEQSLTMPQMLFSLACASAAYGLAGRARGMAFPNLMIVLMFGIFVLRPRQLRLLSLIGIVMIGSVMAWKAATEPEVYEPAIELAHFVFVALIMPAVAVLAGQLSGLRARLNDQKAELAAALERIQLQAIRDDLTGLANRRHMMDVLSQEHARCARSGQAFCIALIDIDHFKRVNDAHGHAVGDEVLRVFAEIGRVEMRDADLLSRWGGEEFLVLMPDTPLALARLALDRLRAKVATTPIEIGGPAGVRLSITVSGGLAEYWPQESMSELIERADRALYDAKEQGRDRVVTA